MKQQSKQEIYEQALLDLWMLYIFHEYNDHLLIDPLFYQQLDYMFQEPENRNKNVCSELFQITNSELPNNTMVCSAISRL